MNLKKLKAAEKAFLNSYPGGFADPGLADIGKRHKVEQMTTLTQDAFKTSRFRDKVTTIENMIKVVSRSSMVSMFEKPKFRDAVNGMSIDDRATLSNSLKAFLHGNQEKGLQGMVDVLAPSRLAKWSVITIIPNYFHPDTEVFVKPTTAKGIIKHFELDELNYRPTPYWEFYSRYRDIILEMKSKVDPSLQPNNAAFCGFLMMILNQEKS